MKRLLILLPFLLAACTSASLSMRNAPVRDVPVGGQTFRVYGPNAGGQVEAHRINFSAPPSRVQTFRNASQAIMIATSCTIRKGSLRGDQAIIQATVSCK